MPTPTHCPSGHAYDEVNTYWQVRQNGHKTPSCRTCQNARQKAARPYYTEYRKKWRTENRDRERKNWTKLRKSKKEWLTEYKAVRGCSRCPEKDPVCLDFHHRNPEEKEMTLSLAIARASLESIQKEVEKCDILCANCHRKLHATEREMEKVS